MNSMYANRITVAINGNEAFIKFDCLAPKYNEDSKPVGTETKESQEIIVTTDSLARIRDLIDEVIEQNKE